MLQTHTHTLDPKAFLNDRLQQGQRQKTAIQADRREIKSESDRRICDNKWGAGKHFNFSLSIYSLQSPPACEATGYEWCGKNVIEGEEGRSEERNLKESGES